LKLPRDEIGDWFAATNLQMALGMRRGDGQGGRVYVHLVGYKRRGRQGQREAPAGRRQGICQAGQPGRGRLFYDPAVSGADPIEARPGCSP
jgi:hypothetical protein